MASVYDLKPAFQGALRPVVGALARRRITANQVTLAAAFGSIALGGALLLWPGEALILLAMPAWLLVRMALNAIDGLLARGHAMSSSLGVFLNELGDLVSDAALYLPLALVPGLPPALVTGAVVLALLAETAGVVAVQAGTSRVYDGPMGKSDRAAVFGLLALLLGIGIAPAAWSTALLVAVNVLLVTTIVNRVRHALEEIQS